MLSEEIIQKIAHARTVSDPASDAGRVTYENIGEMLFKQARDLDTKPYLIYYDAEGNRREDNYKDFFMLASMCASMMRSFGIKRGDRIATIARSFVHAIHGPAADE